MVEASLYEQLFPLTTIMKQRVVENFDGDALDERWQTVNYTGVNTFAMDDTADGGFKITTAGGATDAGAIYFNNIRQYDHLTAILLFVSKLNNNTDDNLYKAGLVNDGATLPNLQHAYIQARATLNMNAVTADATTQSRTTFSPAVDTNWRAFKIECLSASIKFYELGVLKVTKTTNLPTVKQQPAFVLQSIAVANVKSAQIRYLEAFNV